MALPNLSKKKADAISNGVFLIALGILFYTNAWWPGILLAIWGSLATRQFLTGRIYDLVITSSILLGLYLIYYIRVDLTVLMPIVLVIGGIYIIFREYYYSGDESIDRRNIETEKEIEEDDK